MGRDRHKAREQVKLIRRQHVVSRFYLSGFASPAGQLLQVHLPGHRSNLTNINNATVIKDFYTVDRPDGTRTDLFERLFNEIEQPAATALRAMLPHRDQPDWRGIGLSTAGGFAVPLSRRLSLVIGASPQLPDMRVPGTRQLAEILNAGIIGNARRSLFHSTDDAHILEELPARLPEPRERENGPAHTEGLIREEGLFAHLSPAQRSAFPSPPGDANDGFSLADLPWPIHGREPTTATDD